MVADGRGSRLFVWVIATSSRPASLIWCFGLNRHWGSQTLCVFVIFPGTTPLYREVGPNALFFRTRVANFALQSSNPGFWIVLENHRREAEQPPYIELRTGATDLSTLDKQPPSVVYSPPVRPRFYVR
jgi:hypothetical protein